jgi:Virulence factor BrkB
MNGCYSQLVGASGAFNELQEALNIIWKVDTRTKSFWKITVRQRVFSLGLVIATGFLLMTSLVVTASLSAAERFVSHLLPMPAILLESINFVFSFAMITILFWAHLKIYSRGRNSMAGRPDGRSDNVPPLYGRQVRNRILFGPFSLNIGLWCRHFTGRFPGLDLLLGADPTLRG